MTVQQMLDAMNAAPNVLEAWIEKAPASFGRAGTLYSGRIAWAQVVNGVAEVRGADIMVKNLGLVVNEVNVEETYWIGHLPAPLVAAVPDAYITGRTVPFTKVQVEAFCNTQWKATSGNAAARDVIEFTLSNVTPNTVRVQGLFHDVASNNRLRLTYLISLVDANGATTGTNVKFEKVVE
jgi:hypothetical protein